MAETYDCFYCKAPNQVAPGECKKCGVKLAGPIRDMTIADLEKIVHSNGYRLKLEAIPLYPQYCLAV